MPIDKVHRLESWMIDEMETINEEDLLDRIHKPLKMTKIKQILPTITLVQTSAIEYTTVKDGSFKYIIYYIDEHGMRNCGCQTERLRSGKARCIML